VTVTEAAPSTEASTIPRLKARYQDEIKAQLQADLDIKNVMQVPNLEKIVINMGVGKATQQPSLLEAAVADLTTIAGQKPIVTTATEDAAGKALLDAFGFPFRQANDPNAPAPKQRRSRGPGRGKRK